MNKHFFTMILFLLSLLVSRPAEARLMLGVITGSDEAAGQVTSEQAGSLANLLAEKLQEKVAVKEFSDSATLINWLDRFAMLDLALLSAKVVKDNPGKFLQIGPFDEQGKLSMVCRQGVGGDLPQRITAIVRDSGFVTWKSIAQGTTPASPRMHKSGFPAEPESFSADKEFVTQVELQHVPPLSPGRSWVPQESSVYLDVLPAGEVLAPQVDLSAQQPVAVQKPEVVTEVKTSLTGQERQTVEEFLSPAPEHVEPVETEVPTEVVMEALPLLLEIAEPAVILPAVEVPKVIPALSELATMPIEPAQPAIPEAIKMPDVIARQSAPLQPTVPTLPTIADPIPPFEMSAVAELDAVPKVPASPLLGQIPQIPVVERARAVSLPIPVEPVEPELVETPILPQDLVPETAEVIPSDELTEMPSPLILENTETEMWSDEEFAVIMGKDSVAAVVAQPDIPQELRPSAKPVARPGRIVRRETAVEDQLLIASLPEPRKNIAPPRPPNLLPEPEPEPGVVYVVPFVSLMVPDDVDARVFDQFIDTLNREGEALNLQFVILKEGLQRVSPQWLSIRKYVTGEIYAYVEDSGCCSTDLRTKARLSYYLPNQDAPAFGFVYPVKSFFDHDRSTIGIERAKLADDIAMALASELLKALQN
ncbi:MAG: hypothetical protein RQ722_11390 [Desulfuromonadales bacterium]|nr:hypothetical protein [Desulfuromonadales bacterium]